MISKMPQQGVLEIACGSLEKSRTDRTSKVRELVVLEEEV